MTQSPQDGPGFPSDNEKMGLASTFLALGLVGAEMTALTKDWTLMVYMAADNNLEGRAYADIREMEEVGPSDRLNVVVFIDDTSKESKTLEIQKATRNYLGREREHQSKVVTSEGEVDSGSPAILKAFIKRAKDLYPAMNYALVIWGHGYGWSGDVADMGSAVVASPVRSLAIASDGSSGRWIQTPELARLLGESFTDRLDLLAFDACLMGTSEVIDAISPYARYLISSQEELPGGGFPYQKILRAWHADQALPARTLMERWLSVTRETYPADRYAVSVAGFDLAQWERFKDSFNGWLKSVSSARIPEVDMRALGREIGGSTDLSYRDLFEYVAQVRSYAEAKKMLRLAVASERLQNQRGRLIPFAHTTRGFVNRSGLSVYLPVGWWDSEWNRPKESRRSSYQTLRFAFSTLWDEHLDEIWATP